VLAKCVAWGSLLAALTIANGCTTDFTGYHLQMDAAGAPDAEAGASDSAFGGRDSANADAGAGGTPQAGAAGGTAPAAGAAGRSPTTSDAGSAGEPASGGTAGVEISPVVLLRGAPPSCAALASTCGPGGSASCCAASLVPGGTYNRSNQTVAPATVSDFGLDQFEVSVGRFRNFVHAYTQDMIASGAGKNPNNSMDAGWSTDWNARLPSTTAALVNSVTSVGCGATFTYTADPGARESLPMTCLTWYEAFAFCTWDGGRLPTEAEWNYAAAAGDEERPYPWGSATPDASRAVFQPAVLQTVGSKGQSGSGKWGQMDMSGNAWEWTLDVYAAPYLQTTCQDCANTATAVNTPRVFRGGSAGNTAGFLLAATRNDYDPSKSTGYIGVRCARAP